MEVDDDEEDKERLDLLVAEFEKLFKASRDRIIDPKLRAAHICSSNHRPQIEASTKCGCFYCQRIFQPTTIEDWTDDDTTALCPFCGMDAVLGDASGFPISKIFFADMYQVYF